ncbi:MAG: ABC transporter ATP-binding protein [Candidatus Sericytochromatia bacterium]
MNELDKKNFFKKGSSLEVSELEFATYGKKILSGNITFTLKPNEIIGLLGPSGSGKSTLLKSCCGLIKPTKGKILIDKQNLYENISLLRNKIGYVPQDDIIHQDLSVEKAIYYSAKLRLGQNSNEEKIKALTSKVIGQVGLQGRETLKIKKLSGGQRKRASIAVELLSDPSLLFLDEPTSGQDPQLEEALMKLFKDMTKMGTSIIITTHAMANIELLDLVLLIQSGNLVFFGPPKELLVFFESNSYEGVFKVLAKNTPDFWFKKYLESNYFKDYLVRRII